MVLLLIARIWLTSYLRFVFAICGCSGLSGVSVAFWCLFCLLAIFGASLLGLGIRVGLVS